MLCRSLLRTFQFVCSARLVLAHIIVYFIDAMHAIDVQAPMLLFRAIQGKLADVKRLYAIRTCFYNFDLGDEESITTVNNILRVMMNPVVLRSQEGRRLVAFFFDHCQELTQDLTHIMKSTIVLGQAYALEAYGANWRMGCCHSLLQLRGTWLHA